MCLLTPKRTRRIAEEDIHVWKIVKLTEDKKHWDGPYFKAGFKFDEIAEVEPPEEKDIKTSEDGRLYLEEGFLYSTLKYVVAKRELHMLRYLRHKYKSQYRLVRATIPKGSIYYTGRRTTYQGEDTTIASNKLIVEKPTGRYTQD